MPNRDSHPAGSPGWVDLSTSDAGGAKEFYAGLFRWEWEDVPGPGGRVIYSMSSLDGRLVGGLSQITPEMGDIPTAWNTYFVTDSADESHAAAEAAGGSAIMPPTDVLDSGRLAFMTDDQGAAFGLWEPRSHRGMGVVMEPGAHCWTELIAPDAEQAGRFYGSVFGWEAQDAPISEGPAYRLWMRNGEMIAGLMEPPEPDIPTCWTIYFGTADSAVSSHRAVQLGGRVLKETFPTPGGDVTVLQDPQGGVFSVLAMREWPAR